MITSHQVKQTACSFTRKSRLNEPVNEQTTEPHTSHPFATPQNGDAGSVHRGLVQRARHMVTKEADTGEVSPPTKTEQRIFMRTTYCSDGICIQDTVGNAEWVNEIPTTGSLSSLPPWGGGGVWFIPLSVHQIP